mgnify:CR=1 FL=1
MPKFKKKSEIVTAIQFNGSSTHANQIKHWIEHGAPEPSGDGIHTRDLKTIEIETMDGIQQARPNDYILKFDNGDVFAYGSKIFELIYEPA